MAPDAKIFLAQYVLGGLILTPLLAGAAWSLDLLLRDRPLTQRHSLWVLTLLACIACPFFVCHAPYANKVPVPAATTFGAQRSDLSQHVAHNINDPAPLVLSSRNATLLLMFYGVQALCILIRLCFRVFAVERLRRHATNCDLPAPMRDSLRALCEHQALKEPTILISDRLDSPVALASSIILPSKFLAETRSDDMNAVFAHECAHLTRSDYRKNLTYELLSAFIPLYPVWMLIRRRIGDTRELVCDHNAASLLGDRHQYASSLVTLAGIMTSSNDRYLNAIGLFGANIFEERVMKMITDPVSQSKSWKLVSRNAALTLAFVLAAGTAVAAVNVDVQQSSRYAYRVGGAVKSPHLLYAKDAMIPTGPDSRSGTTRVNMVVNTDGLTESIRVVSPLTPINDAAAMNAVSQYRFKPGTKDGLPVPVQMTVDVVFP